MVSTVQTLALSYYSPLYNLIKYADAAYLVYIGIQALRSKRAATAAIERSLSGQNIGVKSNWQALRDGFFTNLLNPKATLLFVALFTQIVGPGMPLHVQAVFGLTCAVMVAGWFTLVAVLMTRPAIRSGYLAVSAKIDKVLGALLIAFGVKIALSRAS